jgi:hypothetical protein
MSESTVIGSSSSKAALPVPGGPNKSNPLGSARKPLKRSGLVMGLVVERKVRKSV